MMKWSSKKFIQCVIIITIILNYVACYVQRAFLFVYLLVCLLILSFHEDENSLKNKKKEKKKNDFDALNEVERSRAELSYDENIYKYIYHLRIRGNPWFIVDSFFAALFPRYRLFCTFVFSLFSFVFFIFFFVFSCFFRPRLSCFIQLTFFSNFKRWLTKSQYEMLLINDVNSGFFFLTMIDEKSIWNVIYKKYRFWFFFWSFFFLVLWFLMFAYDNLLQFSFFFIFIFSMFFSFLIFRFLFCTIFFIYICHNLSVFNEKKIVLQFFDDAKTNKLIFLNEANVNNDKISKNFEFDTKINYDRMLHFWHE